MGKRRQKALLIGLNYPGTNSALYGCINDVESMKDLLIGEFGYHPREIIIKTDPQMKSPENFIQAFKQLIDGAKSNDHLFFHYSGHGTQVPDQNGDEDDGLDEALYFQGGSIIDDQLADLLVQLPEGVIINLLFDCCHSESMADLPYHYREQKCIRDRTSKKFKATIRSVSGCRDDQTSADAYLKEYRKSHGVMTASILTLAKNKDLTKMTWVTLLKEIRQQLHGFSQVPQLCTNLVDGINSNVFF